ncbi:transcriptional regulator GutM [Virgibacillus xinjiangensis]|uniref:Transcriptional regulator GutM n=1 Tax=Virgibacillus xinjiangensis TaxID=393090 RepID=A0ABV7CTC3_9BACI
MNLIIIACLILVMNYALTFIQVRHYRKSMEKLISRYRGNSDYYLFSGQSRRMLKSGSIAMLIVDKDYNIIECQVMKGVSVLTSFKAVERYKGLHVGTLLSDLHDKHTPSKDSKKKKIPAITAALMSAAENALMTIPKKRA